MDQKPTSTTPVLPMRRARGHLINRKNSFLILFFLIKVKGREHSETQLAATVVSLVEHFNLVYITIKGENVTISAMEARNERSRT